MSQKKAKFNVVDIIVVLILIAGIAFVGTRMLGSRDPADVSIPSNAYRVTFSAECVDETVAERLEEGSRAESGDRVMDLGTLTEFTIDESVWYTADSKGNAVQTTKPGCVSVTLVCELTGTEQPTGLLVGKQLLNVGQRLDVCCGMTQISAVVTDIAPAIGE